MLSPHRYSWRYLFLYGGHLPSGRPILCDAPVRAALRHAIQTVRADYPFVIDAWVMLPDHLHCLWTLPPDDADYTLRWGLIKRSVSLSCAEHYHRDDWMTSSKTKHRESTLWQRRFWEHCIRNETGYSRHVDYIYINPCQTWLGFAGCRLAILHLSENCVVFNEQLNLYISVLIAY